MAQDNHDPDRPQCGTPSPDGGGTALDSVAQALPEWARSLGFSQIGVSDVDLSTAEPGLQAWLDAGFHAGMGYMANHGLKRARPAELVPGTVRVITARMDYLPESTWAQGAWRAQALAELEDPGLAVVSLYARGRDYHKVLRQRLQALANRLADAVGPFGHRVFTDSAPVLEVELATRAGLGWRGKHTLALSRHGGSMFFLGEIYVDLPLPITAPETGHCGACSRCLEACPTGAIVAPGRLDAGLCISYLTIEHEGPIPVALRSRLGNRVYGCDDCQRVCPWNKFAQPTRLADFSPRAPWQEGSVAWERLWDWDEARFLQQMEGSPIRRIGHWRWRRNLAVAAGNALASRGLAEGRAQGIRHRLEQALTAQPDAVLAEHLAWALSQGG